MEQVLLLVWPTGQSMMEQPGTYLYPAAAGSKIFILVQFVKNGCV